MTAIPYLPMTSSRSNNLNVTKNSMILNHKNVTLRRTHWSQAATVTASITHNVSWVSGR